MISKSKIILIIGIGLIIGSFILMYCEIKPAKEFCSSINGNYTNSKLTHKCNGIEIYKYNSKLFGEYWDFSPRENFSIALT